MKFRVFDWIHAVIASDASPPARCGALTLVVHFDQNGVCFPSRERIAKLSGVSERTARAWLSELEGLGLIHRSGRFIRATFGTGEILPELGEILPDAGEETPETGETSPDTRVTAELRRANITTEETGSTYPAELRTPTGETSPVTRQNSAAITTQLTTQLTQSQSRSARDASPAREMGDEKPANQTESKVEVVDDRPDLMFDLLSALQNDFEEQPLPPVTPEPEKRVSVAPVESTHETLDVWISREFAKWERAINPQVGVTIAAACMGVGMDEPAIRQYVAERLAEFATDNTSTRIVTRAMMQDAGKFKERSSQPAFAPRGAKRESTRATYQHTTLNPVDDLPLAWEYDGPEAFKIAADEWIAVVEAAGLDWRKKHNWDATERTWSGRFKDEC